MEVTPTATNGSRARVMPLESPSLTPQKQVPSNNSQRLIWLKSALTQYEENQAFIKWKQAKYYDPRNVPQDMLQQEELIKQKIEEVQLEINQLEQLQS